MQTKELSGMAKTLITTCVIFTITICTILTFIVVNREKASIENGLLLRAENAALLFDHEDILALDGNITDERKSEYEKLKWQLQRMSSINTDTRFIYIMGYEGGDSMFFYVDSEDPDSPDFSPPGQVFEDLQEGEIVNYISGRSYVLDPYEDAWGTWLSAMAPIIHPNTGETIALVGLDIDAHNYRRHINSTLWMMILIGVLLTLVVSVLGVQLVRSHEVMGLLSTAHEELKKKHEHIVKKQSLMKVGSFSWAIKSGTITFDQEMSDILGAPIGNKISYEDLKWKMAASSRDLFESEYHKALANSTYKFDTTLDMTDKNGSSFRMDCNCEIELDGAGQPHVLHASTRVL